MGLVSAKPPAGVQSIFDSGALDKAERCGRPFLLFSDRDGRPQVFSFAPGSGSVSVGRHESSDLLLGWDDRVSRAHARFERADAAWVLVDDGFSSNGTFVNEERLTGRRRLVDGDVLRFGSTTVTFRSPGRAPPATVLSSTQRRVLVALCRPYKGGRAPARPAGDEQIAEELFLAAGEVRAHLRVLSAKLGVGDAPDAELRARLAERAFAAGLISDRDL